MPFLQQLVLRVLTLLRDLIIININCTSIDCVPFETANADIETGLILVLSAKQRCYIV